MIVDDPSALMTLNPKEEEGKEAPNRPNTNVVTLQTQMSLRD
jgi:hypothetical protein